MRRAGLTAVTTAALLTGLAGSASAGWHATAGALPKRFHLVETAPARSKGGVDEVCYGGPVPKNVDPESDCDSNSLAVFTLRGGATSGTIGSASGSEHQVRVRGRRARWHWLKDEGSRFARELIIRARPGLRVAVVADRGMGLRNLLLVARHIRALDGHAWRLLLRQTTYEAQLGRFEPGMRRVQTAAGTAGGDPWRLDVLIPPGYPLSHDDLRPACVELTYRGETGRGEFCQGSWQRVAGQVFVFGPLPRSWLRFQVHFYRNYKDTPVGDTHKAAGWPQQRFYAMPLGTNTCDLYLDNPDNRDDDRGPTLTPPPGTPDYHRCGFDQEPA